MRPADVVAAIAARTHDWSDYLDLLTALVDTLARVERRSALSLLADLTTATSDVVRLRAITGPASDGTIGVGAPLRWSRSGHPSQGRCSR